MKVLVYSANYAPEPTGIGKYSGEMASWLAAAGHEVRVVSAPPYYPSWSISAPYKAWQYKRETLNGVDVWRTPLWVPKHLGGLTRVLHLLTFAVSSFPVMLWQTTWRPDAVITIAPALVCAPMGWFTARLCGAKAWLHVQDFEVDVAFRLGLLRKRWLGAAVRLAESFLLRRFDKVSSISHAMVSRAARKGVAPQRLYHFPNWVDISSIQPLNRVSAYRRELGIDDDAVVALYSGSLGAKHGLMLLPEAAKRLAHVDKLMFVICGDGALKAELQAACADLPNVRMLPLQPAERLGELLGMADIHLLPQSQEAEDLVLPSKLCGMLASGRPVVATCRPDTEIATAIDGRGMRVPPHDVEAFAKAVAKLAAEPAVRQALGASARAFAVNHLEQRSVLKAMLAELAGPFGPAAVDTAFQADTVEPAVAGGAMQSTVF